MHWIKYLSRNTSQAQYILRDLNLEQSLASWIYLAQALSIPHWAPQIQEGRLWFSQFAEQDQHEEW